jgi:hypothetical protein
MRGRQRTGLASVVKLLKLQKSRESTSREMSAPQQSPRSWTLPSSSSFHSRPTLLQPAVDGLRQRDHWNVAASTSNLQSYLLMQPRVRAQPLLPVAVRLSRRQSHLKTPELGSPEVDRCNSSAEYSVPYATYCFLLVSALRLLTSSSLPHRSDHASPRLSLARFCSLLAQQYSEHLTHLN